MALSELILQDHPNVRAMSNKYNLVESTLRRRFKGQTMSHGQCASEFKQRLTNAQEEALIIQID